MSPNQAWNGVIHKAFLMEKSDELTTEALEENQDELMEKNNIILMENHVIILHITLTTLAKSCR